MACSSARTQAGGIELLIATNLTTPNDFDTIVLQIAQQTSGGDGGQWESLINQDFLVPGETTLPTTFAVIAGKSTDQVVLVTLVALKDGQPVDLRQAQVQVPTDRVAAMTLILAESCVGQVATVGGAFASTCAAGESCQPATGTCGPTVISTPLPTYSGGSQIDASVGDFVRDASTDTVVTDAILPAGTVTEFAIPTTHSDTWWGVTAGPDGAVWFTEGFGNKIGRITTGGVLTEFPIPTLASDPTAITSGPDGALWFTEAAGRKIGRVTTAGMFTEFPIPAEGSSDWITSGPDGALWFTEGAAIVRMTTAGAFTEFSVPTATMQPGPGSITLGPDGALWFTCGGANEIGRMTTAGVLTEFTVPTAGADPEGMTLGPDGALWFAEGAANKIGRITTAGVLTELAIPTAGSAGFCITSGPDGALWFTEPTANKIGRMTTAGTFTEFPIPTASSSPSGITSGPGGAVWFTEADGNNVGRIIP